jgi:uncharacterized membrane protein
LKLLDRLRMMQWREIFSFAKTRARNLIAATLRYIPRDSFSRSMLFVALIICIVLLLTPRIIPLDGHTHADWEQFLGRFHPLIVHLPIGLLILVPLLEIAGSFEPSLREAAGFILWLAFFCCLGAVTLGLLLAHGSGDAGPGVTRHLWGGILLTIAIVACLITRPYWSSHHGVRAYPVLLTAALFTMLWTAHQGGSLTHGSNYLTQYMPQPAKRWVTVGFTRSKAAPDSFYTKHIHPVFDAECVSCHGDAKIKGGLRLDSYEALMSGGQDGAVITPGKPDTSMLVQRITLPPDHKQFMPAEGKPPLRPEQITWIKAWIAAGASPTATSVPGVTIHEPHTTPLTPVADYTALMPEIRTMQQAQGAKLSQVSANPADGLVLNTVDAPATFDDVHLAQFEKFAPYIIEVDLARTSVTNASFITLAKFTHLRAIHLEATNITGDGIAKLAALPQLSYINLSNTKVTNDAVGPLRAMKGLEHLYLYNTPAEPIAPVPPIETAAQPAPEKDKQ